MNGRTGVADTTYKYSAETRLSNNRWLVGKSSSLKITIALSCTKGDVSFPSVNIGSNIRKTLRNSEMCCLQDKCYVARQNTSNMQDNKVEPLGRQ